MLTACDADFALFHEDALQNATAVLQAEGKIKGDNVKPFSVQDFFPGTF